MLCVYLCVLCWGLPTGEMRVDVIFAAAAATAATTAAYQMCLRWESRFALDYTRTSNMEYIYTDEFRGAGKHTHAQDR